MSKGGRPCHDYWERGQFIRQTRNDKLVAACALCDKVLLNTSQSRLQQHRNVCPKDHDSKLSSPIIIKNNPIKTGVSSSSSSSSVAVPNGIFINGIPVNSSADNLQYIVVPVNSNMQPIENEEMGNIINQLPNRKRKADQANIKTWIDSITNEDQKKADKLLLKFLYSSNLPLGILESVHFMNFVKALRPAYRLPTSEDTYEILDEIME
ncbi:uncharacterized protein LOC122858008 [Aphidius gifuensis]|uniref:uncharacterized protein LOC122858008 n=1 Tax=Aphidius gifuensis TaxID=684658 RepID=UPI001CDBC036|nr:uncharacterized protein LOC122858008 [Aphidius gifuensis]